MDWITFSFAVATSLASGGLLAWGLDLWKFRHEAGRSQWQDFLNSYEKQIESAEKRQEHEETHRLRKEYEVQLEAWRGQQELNVVAPRAITTGAAPGLTMEEVQRLKELLDASKALSPAAVRLPEDHWLRGNALYEAGQYLEAAQEYDRALALKPDYLEVLNNKGVALSHLGRHQEALEALDKALALKPDHVSAVYNKACAYGLMHNGEAALEWLARAIKADGKYRTMAQTDSEFAFLREHSEYGPRFRLFSSVSALGNAGQSNYGSAKASQIGFGTALAMELVPYGITVNVVFPGGDARMTAALPESSEAYRAQWGIPSPQVIEDLRDPERNAPNIVYLCTEAASNITGQVPATFGLSMSLYSPRRVSRVIHKDGPWPLDELDVLMPNS